MQPKSSRDQASQDSSRPEFWDARYASGEIPWDFHGVPVALKDFLATSQAGSVLIPGCGLAYEVRAFDEAGWKVTAIDFSPVAVERSQSELGSLANRVVEADFFKHDFGSQRFDLIYERTFLCALPPDSWPAYVKRMIQLLRPSGKLAGIFLYGDQAEPPPYPLTPAKASELLGKNFFVIKTVPVTDSLPLFAGNEYWQEWVLNDAVMG
jgi:SAM-dependent methyltransferase